MNVLAIELNDAGIRAARSGDDALLSVDGEHAASPGVAWIEGRSVVTGRAAAPRAGLHSLDLHDRFWDRLDTESIDARHARSPNRAEVACAHLALVAESIVEPDDEVVIAVPPFYEPEQLGILAGIARELRLPLRGLVASPIAIDEPDSAGGGDPGVVLVVELSLHRCTLSIVEGAEERVLRTTRTCPDASLLAFRRQWMKAIGGEFVRATRFDPVHDATTEQQLHDRLPVLLETLAREGSTTLVLESASRTHTATVTDQLLTNAGHGLAFGVCRDVGALVEAQTPTRILLNHEAARVPGLPHALQRQTATTVQALPAGAAARDLVRLWPDRFDQSVAPSLAFHERRASAAAAPGEVSR
ncbi:MAG: hypothetical protein GY715_22450 [Planctomycetes bacterium]|nr:hypothetical protein [Planctomycetota bacterium]